MPTVSVALEVIFVKTWPKSHQNVTESAIGLARVGLEPLAIGNYMGGWVMSTANLRSEGRSNLPRMLSSLSHNSAPPGDL
jgi:hypothetical protein